MVAHPIESHPRSGIFLRSTCFVRMLRNPFGMRVSGNCFSIVLPADIRPEKKNAYYYRGVLHYKRIIIVDDIIDAIFVDHISKRYVNSHLLLTTLWKLAKVSRMTRIRY